MPSPLIRSLIERHGIAHLDGDTIDEFLQSHDDVVLFFTENPHQFPESNDVAVVLPELLKAFDGRLTAAVVHRDAERALQKRYGFTAWPALVFLRRGKYLGIITRVQDWNGYLSEIERLLNSAPSQPPAFKIAVVAVAAHTSTPTQPSPIEGEGV